MKNSLKILLLLLKYGGLALLLWIGFLLIQKSFSNPFLQFTL